MACQAHCSSGDVACQAHCSSGDVAPPPPLVPTIPTTAYHTVRGGRRLRRARSRTTSTLRSCERRTPPPLALPVGLVNLVCKSVVATRLATVLISPSLSLSLSSSLFLALPLSSSLSLSLSLSLSVLAVKEWFPKSLFSAPQNIGSQTSAPRRAHAPRGARAGARGRSRGVRSLTRTVTTRGRSATASSTRRRRHACPLLFVLIGHAASFTPY